MKRDKEAYVKYRKNEKIIISTASVGSLIMYTVQGQSMTS